MAEEEVRPSRRSTPFEPGKAWPVFFLLVAVEALAMLARLALVPADPKNSVLFGFSLSRLVMLGGMLAAAAVFVFLAVQSSLRPAWRARWIERWVQGRAGFALGMAALAVLSLGSWLALVLLRAGPEGALGSTYQRLHPPLLLAFLTGAQGLVWLPLARCGLHPDALRPQKKLFALVGAIFLVFLLLAALITTTGYGVTPDLYAWGLPGVPLLAWQVLLVSLAGCGLFLLARAFRDNARTGRFPWLDLALCAAIWALAAGIWLSQPIRPTFFNPQLRPPNMEYYPYSDAGYYDYNSESLAAGSGFVGNKVISRPLYVLFLAVIHTLAGHGYAQVIALQTLALALLPVGMYLLGKAFHSRAAGVTLALLVILREVNTFNASTLTEVSDSKLLLSDLPAALAVVFTAWLVFRWLAKPSRRWMPLVVGGAFGVLALVRAQSVILLPAVLLLALLVYGIRNGRWRLWLESCALAAVGMLLVAAPWMLRSYSLGAGFAIDQPGNQMIILAQRYSTQLQMWPDRQPGESDAAYSSRLLGIAKDFALQHPVYTAGFIGAHFLNNELDTLAVLPLNFKFDDYQDTVVLKTLFWKDLFRGLTPLGAGMLLLNLLLISAGLAVSWRRWRWVGLLPLLVNFGYSASNAIARNSGWRYILPADWVGYFYFVIGVLALFGWGLALLGRRAGGDEEAQSGFTPSAWTRADAIRIAAIAALFLALGLLVPLSARLFPQQYPPLAKTALADELLASPALQKSRVDTAQLRDFLAQDNSVLLRGRALYPRFYYPGQGELGNSWPAHKSRDFSRMVFLVVETNRVRHVMLPLGKVPSYFPQASDVIVVGCASPDGYVTSLLTLVGGKTPRSYAGSPSGPFTCPKP